MNDRKATMTINLRVPDLTELKPRITVFGVGGAGGNAVNNMIECGLKGVEFVVANTDAQALASSTAERRIQMGANVTEGLGAGSKPEVGAAAAEEAMADIKAHLVGCHMVFITAGMGGGTGTGAAPVIARASREEGILTVGVVTKPFQFEGSRRLRAAEAGIDELQKYVDTLLIIPNQNLFRVANEKTTFTDAFSMADDVLRGGVACITDLMVKEGLINLDFADVRTIMAGMGKAMMGTGESNGDRRAIEAAEAAISNPLLDDVCMKGASALLVSITGGNDLTLYEVDEAASRIRAEADPDANIIVGATFDDELDGSIRVSVVATGIGLAPQVQFQAPPMPLQAAVCSGSREAERETRGVDRDATSLAHGFGRGKSRPRRERDGEGAASVARSRQCDDREASPADAGSAAPARHGQAATRRAPDDLPACRTRHDPPPSAAHAGRRGAAAGGPERDQGASGPSASAWTCRAEAARGLSRAARGRWSRAQGAGGRNAPREAGAGVRPATAVARDAEDAAADAGPGSARTGPPTAVASCPKGGADRASAASRAGCVGAETRRAPAASSPGGNRWCSSQITRRRRPRDSGLPPQESELDGAEEVNDDA